jgi:hypothetical protein
MAISADWLPCNLCSRGASQGESVGPAQICLVSSHLWSCTNGRLRLLRGCCLSVCSAWAGKLYLSQSMHDVQSDRPRAQPDQRDKLSSCSTSPCASNIHVHVSIHPPVNAHTYTHSSTSYIYATRQPAPAMLKQSSAAQDSCLQSVYHHRPPKHAKGPLSPPSPSAAVRFVPRWFAVHPPICRTNEPPSPPPSLQALHCIGSLPPVRTAMWKGRKKIIIGKK